MKAFFFLIEVKMGFKKVLLPFIGLGEQKFKKKRVGSLLNKFRCDMMKAGKGNEDN